MLRRYSFFTLSALFGPIGLCRDDSLLRKTTMAVLAKIPVERQIGYPSTAKRLSRYTPASGFWCGLNGDNLRKPGCPYRPVHAQPFGSVLKQHNIRLIFQLRSSIRIARDVFKGTVSV
jgi:hypothetical protein